MAKGHNLSVTECLVSSSCVMPKLVESTYSQFSAEHEIFGKTASLRQVAISNKLADPVWRTYEALRAQHVQETASSFLLPTLTSITSEAVYIRAPRLSASRPLSSA